MPGAAPTAGGAVPTAPAPGAVAVDAGGAPVGAAAPVAVVGPTLVIAAPGAVTPVAAPPEGTAGAKPPATGAVVPESVGAASPAQAATPMPRLSRSNPPAKPYFLSLFPDIARHSRGVAALRCRPESESTDPVHAPLILITRILLSLPAAHSHFALTTTQCRSGRSGRSALDATQRVFIHARDPCSSAARFGLCLGFSRMTLDRCRSGWRRQSQTTQRAFRLMSYVKLWLDESHRPVRFGRFIASVQAERQSDHRRDEYRAALQTLTAPRLQRGYAPATVL